MTHRWILILIIVAAFGKLTPASAQEDFERVEILGRGRIDDVGWLPDGRLAAFGARGIWVYDEITSDAEPELTESPYGWIRSAAIAEPSLATGHHDGSITIWDTANLTETTHFDALEYPVTSIALSEDGTRVAAGGGRDGVQVWDIASQTLLLHQDYGADYLISDVAVSPDGRWLYVLRLWQAGDAVGLSQLDITEIDKPQRTQTLEDIGIYVAHIGVDPTGRWVVLPSGEGLFVWDMERALLIDTAFEDTVNTTIPLFNDQEIVLYTEWSIARVEMETWEALDHVSFDEPFYAAEAALADTGLALIADPSFNGETLRVWSLATDETFDFAYEGSVSSIMFEDNQIVIEHADPALPLYTVDPPPDSGLLWNANDPWEYQNYFGSHLEVTETGQTLETSYRISTATFSPDRRVIAVGTETGEIHWLDAENLQELGVWEHNDGRVLAIVFSPDGERMAVGTESGLVHVWQIQ